MRPWRTRSGRTVAILLNVLFLRISLASRLSRRFWEARPFEPLGPRQLYNWAIGLVESTGEET